MRELIDTGKYIFNVHGRKQLYIEIVKRTMGILETVYEIKLLPNQQNLTLYMYINGSIVAVAGLDCDNNIIKNNILIENNIILPEEVIDVLYAILLNKRMLENECD